MVGFRIGTLVVVPAGVRIFWVSKHRWNDEVTTAPVLGIVMRRPFPQNVCMLLSIDGSECIVRSADVRAPDAKKNHGKEEP